LNNYSHFWFDLTSRNKKKKFLISNIFQYFSRFSDYLEIHQVGLNSFKLYTYMVIKIVMPNPLNVSVFKELFIKPIMKTLFIAFLSHTNTVFAAYSTVIPKHASFASQWQLTHANACLVADNIHRVNADGECLAIQTYYANEQLPKAHSRLLIFIHGDGILGGGPSDYLKYQATKFTSSNTISVVLIRPGYYDSYNNYSTGESYAFSCEGPCDGYRNKTVETLAATIRQLKNFYQANCVILVGHSGGAIMSSVILGKYPNLANGAVLASVTLNVREYSKRNGWGDWSKSLSPHEWVDKIPKTNFIYILSGTKDTNTYPDMAKKFFILLKEKGINAHFNAVPDGTHNSIVLENSADFDNAINNALSQCS
jgi:predicted esterase